jgi:hypothetical protein
MKCIALATLLSAVALCAADPFEGTWKLNVAKSKSDGSLARSATVTIKAIDNGQTVTMEGISAEGKPTKTSFTAKFDGKDYPVTGSTSTDTIMLRRISSHALEGTGKKTGKVVSSLQVTVSQDGGILIIEGERITADGKVARSTNVYDRQ